MLPQVSISYGHALVIYFCFSISLNIEFTVYEVSFLEYEFW